MKMAEFIDRTIKKILRVYRMAIFYCRTGQKAYLVGEIILINTNLKFGKNVNIYPYVQFFGDGLIEIGDNVNIGTGSIIYASKGGGVKIGDNTMIAGQSYIIDCDHGTKANELIINQKNSIEKVIIGADCWLGANVTVLKGSKIEDGCIIGAKSLVNRKISKNFIAFGVPAKEIKKREE